MPIATVIIPCGENHLPLLPRAVASAQAQTVPVDILTYVDYDKRGPAYGRNLLASKVTTPFVVMLDADDFLEPTFVERTLSVWRPGSYVYTDWLQGPHYQRAHSCYPFRPNDGERNFHLPPSLFPTAFWKMVGGQDESLWGAEDTDFFWKCNAMGIDSIVLREALFTYTADGFRSKEAGARAEWMKYVQGIHARYEGKYSMACCGKVGGKTSIANDNPGDYILVRPKFVAARLVVGRATKKNYGRHASSRPFYMHPDDVKADKLNYDILTDWRGASPTADQLAQAARTPVTNDGKDITFNANPASVKTVTTAPHTLTADDWNIRERTIPELSALIERAGIRDWAKSIAKGFDIQQTPDELAQLLHLAQSRDVKNVLEIGTGQRAGLASFMVKLMGWHVVSIDIEKPDTDLFESDQWTFIQSDSGAVDVETLGAFDLVIIDGDHSYDATKRDWEKFADLAPLVALHDIDPSGWWGKDDQTGGFWRDISRTATGKLRKGFREFLSGAKQGLGVYVAS